MTRLYTRAPDGHVLIDRSPEDDWIVLASPCSGRGFKFASLFGKALADGKPMPDDVALFRFARVA